MELNITQFNTFDKAPSKSPQIEPFTTKTEPAEDLPTTISRFKVHRKEMDFFGYATQKNYF